MVCRGWTAGYLADIRAQLQQLGPICGDFPESLKKTLVVASHIVELAKVEFAGLGFHVEIGSSYPSSFIDETTKRDSWIPSKIDDWIQNNKKLAGAARAYPQSAYSAL